MRGPLGGPSHTGVPEEMKWTRKARCFWPLAAAILLTDCATKQVAEVTLIAPHVPHPLLGEFLRLTLTYNSGGAMGLSVGPYSRIAFLLFAVVALVVLATLYRRLPDHRGLPAAGLALITGGALGNAFDRLRSARGVVDFIDVGVGDARFWTFNVADVAITAGAILLGLALSRASYPIGPGSSPGSAA
jgi:signal peptidase II